jgi:hypothetical protein
MNINELTARGVNPRILFIAKCDLGHSLPIGKNRTRKEHMCRILVLGLKISLVKNRKGILDLSLPSRIQTV